MGRLYRPVLCRESRLTPWKPLTLSAVAGDGFIIPGVCPMANAGSGAAPQGLAAWRHQEAGGRFERGVADAVGSELPGCNIGRGLRRVSPSSTMR